MYVFTRFMEETQAYEMGLLLAGTTCLGCVEGLRPAVWDHCLSWCSKDLFVALGAEVGESSSDLFLTPLPSSLVMIPGERWKKIEIFLQRI